MTRDKPKQTNTVRDSPGKPETAVCIREHNGLSLAAVTVVAPAMQWTPKCVRVKKYALVSKHIKHLAIT